MKTLVVWGKTATGQLYRMLEQSVDVDGKDFRLDLVNPPLGRMSAITLTSGDRRCLQCKGVIENQDNHTDEYCWTCGDKVLLDSKLGDIVDTLRRNRAKVFGREL